MRCCRRFLSPTDRDAAARDFMAAVHTHLARGVPPAQALAAVPRSLGVLGFACFGTG